MMTVNEYMFIAPSKLTEKDLYVIILERMASKAEISAAISLIRTRQASFRTRRRPGMTDDARFMNTQRLRALEGLCGNCGNLELTKSRSQGKDIVKIGCSEGQNPQELYINTPLGQEANCPLFVRRDS